MSASLTDKITDTRNATRPNSARVSSGRSGGGATLVCDNLTGWPTASKVHFVTYKIDSSSNPVPGTQLDCYGIVSGNNIGSFTVVDGTDTGNAVNDVVEMLPTAAWGQDLSDALMVSHNRNGSLKVGAVDVAAVLASNVVTTAKILDANVTTAKIADGNVTGDKLLNYKTQRQNDTTNITEATAVIQTGWGVIVPGTFAVASETVTFPVAFTNKPIVTVSFGGDATSATTYGSGGFTIKKASGAAIAISNTNFGAYVFTLDGSNWSAGNAVFYQWIAIGI